jgi:hypothetical protein
VEGATNLLGYGMLALLGLLAIGALTLATLLWRQPATRHAELAHSPRAGAVRRLQIGLLAFAGVLLLERFVFAVLTLT